MQQTSPKHKNGKIRIWLWPIRIINKFWKSSVPPGLWIINWIYQNILDINNDIPWMVHFTSRVVGDIKIGEGVWLSFAVSGGCYIQGFNGIEIGDHTIFAPGVKIISSNHNPRDLCNSISCEPIRIGKNCWLGANVVVLPGVQIGDNVIVGAGAVVTKNFQSNTIIGGIPAKIINYLDE